jgi:hypothetical protein
LKKAIVAHTWGLMIVYGKRDKKMTKKTLEKKQKLERYIINAIDKSLTKLDMQELHNSVKVEESYRAYGDVRLEITIKLDVIFFEDTE